MELHDYQRRAVAHLQKHDGAGLFLDMGLGKTAAVLTALEPHHLPALVIAPKRVAENVWSAERDLWRPDLSIAVAAGSPKKRAAALSSGADIVVIGRDNIKDIAPGHPFKTLVLDELSGFKSQQSKRWKMAKKLTFTADHVWGLTGTPSPNGLLDLWAQVYLLDRGDRLGKFITHYRERYFRAGKRVQQYIPRRKITIEVVTEWLLKPDAEAAIHRKIDDICLSMSALDHLDLPPVTRNGVDVPLPPKTMKVYETMKEHLVADLDLVGDTAYTAANAAVLSSRLSQISAGFLYPDPDEPNNPTVTLHDEKMKAVEEIIEGTGSPVLIFYRYREELRRLRQIEGTETIDAKDAIFRWNHGEIPVLLAHPQSAGHGLNLQHGGHTIIWTTLTWSLEEHMQANARLARQGQKNPVVVHYLMSPGTIDGVIMDRLENKKSVQDALMDHLDG